MPFQAHRGVQLRFTPTLIFLLYVGLATFICGSANSLPRSIASFISDSTVSAIGEATFDAILFFLVLSLRPIRLWCLPRTQCHGVRICVVLHHNYLLTRLVAFIISKGMWLQTLRSWFLCFNPICRAFTSLRNEAWCVFCFLFGLWLINICCCLGDLRPLCGG